jgi:membrane protease YdiL (CAAX protease family)
MRYYLESVLGKDNSFRKYIVVIMGSLFSMWLIGGIIMAVAVVIYIRREGNFSPEMLGNIKNLYDLGLPDNFVYTLTLFPFVIGLITSWLLVEKMHGRTFAMTVNGRENIRWNHVFTGFSFWFLMMFILGGISYFSHPDNFNLQFDSDKFITLLVVSLLLIPVQTTFEEYIFRGYLAQGVAAWTKNRWLVICVPALLFGLMHFSNTEVTKHGFWAMMPEYIIFGLFFGLIAVMDDGIELPIGIHAANNLFVCLFVTNEAASLRTPAIFSQVTIDKLAEVIGLVIVISIAVLFFYRKYKWDFAILNEKIRKNEKNIL